METWVATRMRKGEALKTFDEREGESMEIKKIGVLGAGLMGSGIAQVCAEAGFEVSMRDIEARLVQGGLNMIKKNYDRAVSRGKLTKERAEALLSKVNGTVDLALKR